MVSPQFWEEHEWIGQAEHLTVFEEFHWKATVKPTLMEPQEKISRSAWTAFHGIIHKLLNRVTKGCLYSIMDS